MQSQIINYLPDNSKKLPINFHTVSSYYAENHVDRPEGQKDFDQILFVVEGTGMLTCLEKTFELKKGCAFFSSRNVPIEYISKDGLVTAFLTANGSAIKELCDYFGYGDFWFCEHINTEKYLSRLEGIIHEYYEHKRESVLSGMVYSFYLDFFEEKRPVYYDINDKVSLYIEKNFTRKISLSQLADIHGISVSKLCHDFKNKFGYTVFEHVINLRLTYARNYLISVPKAGTTDAATSCGFDDVSYFCRAYKKKFGKTPLEEKAASRR